MQILAEVDGHVGIRMDLAAILGLPLSTLNTVVSKRSKIEKSYSRCGPSISKQPKSLKISPLKELETIPSTWFKQVHTANASIDGLHQKETALHELLV